VRDAELSAPDSGHSSDGRVLECVANGVSSNHSSRTYDYETCLARCRNVHGCRGSAVSRSHYKGRSSSQSTKSWRSANSQAPSIFANVS
jgi:hypothetical protein